jgi:predicted tellurium resistance membrane protein TerC
MEPSSPSGIKQGLIAGVIGLVTVAAWFGVLNLAAGRSPFFTAGVLGSVLLYDAADPSAVSVAAAPVLAYTALHLAVFLGLGLLVSWLAGLADRGFQLWYVSFFAVIFIGFHLFGAIQAFAAPMRSVLSGAMIWGAGIAASVTMMGFLLWKHPKLRGPQTW